MLIQKTHNRSNIKVLLIDPVLDDEGVKGISPLIPYAIGVIGSYLSKHVPEADIKILRMASSIIEYLRKEQIDVLGISNYMWNTNIGNRIARYARELHPEILLIFGGPEINPNPLDKQHYVKKYAHADLMVEHEGEVAFTNIIKTYLQLGRDRVKLRAHIETLGNTFYINDDGNFIKAPKLPNIKELDSIPSPYLMGFFDDLLVQPSTQSIIQTNRGCPYQCTYCQEGDSYYNKMYFHSLEYVFKELDYIAEIVSLSGGLFIVDTNWGMFPQDIEIAKYIRRLQENNGWPMIIDCDTGKSHLKRITKIAEILQGTMTMSNSVQSMDGNVLRNIKRKNLPNLLESIKDFTISQQRTELILPLPAETKETFVAGLSKILDTQASVRFAVYPALMLSNTELDTEESVKKYHLKVMYRQHQNILGFCAGEFVCETERFIVSTSTMTQEDMLLCRAYSLLLSAIMRYDPIYELFLYLDYRGIKRSDYILKLFGMVSSIPEDVQKCINAYNNDYCEETSETEKEVILRMQKCAKDYQTGKKGGDVLKYSVLLWLEHYSSFIEWIFECLRSYAQEDHNYLKEIENLKCYLDCLYCDRYDSGKQPMVRVGFEYDICNWIENRGEIPFDSFKNPVNYVFEKTEYTDASKNLILQSFGLVPEKESELLSGFGDNSRLYMRRLRRTVRIDA
jgi:hypothetical protein